MDKQLQLILDNSPSGIVFLSVKNTIQYSNIAFCGMFGYEKSEIEGINITTLYHPEDLEKQMPDLLRLKNLEIETYESDQRMYRADKSIIWVHQSAHVHRDDNGNVINGLVIYTDITKQKELEASLKNVVSIVAHDLRSPLACIESFSDLFLEHQHCDPKYIRYIDNIKNVSIHAQLLINDLVKVAQLESSSIYLEREIFDINDYLRHIIPIIKVVSEKKEILVIDNTPSEEYFINADKKNIRRVFENLLTNAVKYTNTKGSITISTIVNDNFVKLSITDTGIGIPEHIKPLLFEKFSNSNRRGTSGEQSIGLGLYIVKKILDLHNAMITIESEVSVGTRVDIEFERVFK